MRDQRRNSTLSPLLALACCALLALLAVACASGGGGSTSTPTGEGGRVEVSSSPAGAEPPPAGDEPTAGAAATDPNAAAQPGTPGAPGAPPSVATEPTPAPAAPAMSDAEVLGVLRAVHQSEVKAGELAAGKATSPEVRQFAQTIVTEHQQADQQLVSAAPVPPSPGPLSQLIEQQVKAVLEKLGSASGPAFDQSFIQSQVQMHEQVLQVIEAQLLPSAQSPEVRQLAESTKQSVAQHLQTAQQLAAGLGTGSGG
jgi:putative membrane protein